MLKAQIKSAVILVGGKGTRLKELLNGKPKPLVPILGIPLLNYQINSLLRYGVSNFILLANYKTNVIRDYMDSEFQGINFKIIDDGDVPLGNGGAIITHLKLLPETFFVIYGDTYFNVNFQHFANYHNFKNADITLFTHPNSHPFDSDIVIVDESCQVKQIRAYPHDENFFASNLVNAALYVINKKSLNDPKIKKNKFYDLAKDLIPLLLQSKKTIYSYKSKEYIKDCGTPKRLRKVTDDIISNKTTLLEIQKKTPTIFIDRDGTLIENIPHLNNISQIELIPNSTNAIRKINDKGFLSVVITNQPVIARGELSLSGLKAINDYIEWEFGKNGAYFDAIKFCPHHPDSGFEGEIEKLKINCNCRKPKIDLFKQIESELNIDKSNSWMIGDSFSDIKAGDNFGIKSILVNTGFGGRDYKYFCRPDFQMNNIYDAVNFIFNDYEFIYDKLSKVNIDWKINNLFISGISNSGKSTYASCLKHFILDKKKNKCIVISLDNFMKNRDERNEFPDIYNFSEIQDFFNKRINNDKIIIKPRVYDPMNGNQVEFEDEEIIITPEDFIIFEGLIATKLAIENNFDKNLFFLDTDESICKQRFEKEYQSRKFSEDEINNLYFLRENERKIINNQKKYSVIL